MTQLKRYRDPLLQPTFGLRPIGWKLLFYSFYSSFFTHAAFHNLVQRCVITLPSSPPPSPLSCKLLRDIKDAEQRGKRPSVGQWLHSFSHSLKNVQVSLHLVLVKTKNCLIKWSNFPTSGKKLKAWLVSDTPNSFLIKSLFRGKKLLSTGKSLVYLPWSSWPFSPLCSVTHLSPLGMWDFLPLSPFQDHARKMPERGSCDQNYELRMGKMGLCPPTCYFHISICVQMEKKKRDFYQRENAIRRDEKDLRTIVRHGTIASI